MNTIHHLCWIASLCISLSIPNNLLAQEQDIPDNGVYFNIALTNSFSLVEPSYQTALGLESTIGYRFHQLFGIGVGAGIAVDVFHALAHFNTSIRGDFMNKSFSPYYEVAVGYTALVSMHIPLSSEKTSYSQGGIYLRPCIGMRFASTRKGHCMLDVGLTIQDFGYTMIFDEGEPTELHRYREYLYARPSIRFGFIF